MTFRDVFKSSLLEKAVEFSVLDVALAMLLAFAIGLFIFYVYKKTYSGVMYSAAFGVSIMAMTMITTLIILAVTSNLVLSLGMVGALSIVRFRTAIKEPLDIAFLFWAISAVQCFAKTENRYGFRQRNGYLERRKYVADPKRRRYGVPKPGQPNRRQCGGRRRGIRTGEFRGSA